MLAGRSILVVEDEPLIAFGIEVALRRVVNRRGSGAGIGVLTH